MEEWLHARELTLSSTTEGNTRISFRRGETHGCHVGFTPYQPHFRLGTTRWSTTLSPKVNLHYAIHFRALCGTNLVTQHPNETRVAHRVDGVENGRVWIAVGAAGREPFGALWLRLSSLHGIPGRGYMLAMLFSINNRRTFLSTNEVLRVVCGRWYGGRRMFWCTLASAS